MTKQELEQKIEQLQKQLDELKNVKIEETKKKWIPERYEIYYFVESDCSISCCKFYNDDFDNGCISVGNCFQTKEEAQFVADKIKYTLMFKHYVEEHSELLDWENEEQHKWCVFYNYITHKIDFDYTDRYKEQGTVYASSEQVLQNAIEYVGEDNVKKYILEVED